MTIINKDICLSIGSFLGLLCFLGYHQERVVNILISLILLGILIFLSNYKYFKHLSSIFICSFNKMFQYINCFFNLFWILLRKLLRKNIYLSVLAVSYSVDDSYNDISNLLFENIVLWSYIILFCLCLGLLYLVKGVFVSMCRKLSSYPWSVVVENDDDSDTNIYEFPEPHILDIPVGGCCVDLPGSTIRKAKKKKKASGVQKEPRFWAGDRGYYLTSEKESHEKRGESTDNGEKEEKKFPETAYEKYVKERKRKLELRKELRKRIKLKMRENFRRHVFSGYPYPNSVRTTSSPSKDGETVNEDYAEEWRAKYGHVPVEELYDYQIEGEIEDYNGKNEKDGGDETDNKWSAWFPVIGVIVGSVIYIGIKLIYSPVIFMFKIIFPFFKRFYNAERWEARVEWLKSLWKKHRLVIKAIWRIGIILAGILVWGYFVKRPFPPKYHPRRLRELWDWITRGGGGGNSSGSSKGGSGLR